tara:strand:- start:1040 stop:1420 length:381 start_codon:yes stop_codon:yes gene_type:complete
MKYITFLTSIILLFFVSCASNVRNANVPTFGYAENDFTFGSPKDITINIKPNSKGDRWVLDSGAEVPVGSDLQTVLEKVYPDGDAFKYGKVVNQKNLSAIPLPPSPIVLKQETVISIRAFRIGKHK